MNNIKLTLVIITILFASTIYFLARYETLIKYDSKSDPSGDNDILYRVYKKLKNLNISSGYTTYKIPFTNKRTTLPFTNTPLRTTLPANLYSKTTKSFKNITWPFKPDISCDRSVKSRSTEEGRWYDFSKNNFVLYTYSALIDDRESLKSGPVVRIISIATNVENLSNRPQLYCRFHFPSVQGSNEEKANDFVIDVKIDEKPNRFLGMGWSLNGKHAREIIFTCALPEESLVLKKLKTRFPNYEETFKNLKKDFSIKEKYLRPSWVTILVGNESTATACMPVEVPYKPQEPEGFVLCVQVAFGSINPKNLIIWLELQKLLGVDKVGIYDQNVEKPAMDVLRAYAKEGLVELRKSDYIPHGPQQYLLHGSPVINDCMYRHLHSHKYLLVYDIDEVILPVVNKSTGTPSNFKELLSVLEKIHGTTEANFMFRNRYFFFDHEPDPKEPQEFNILKYKKAAPLSSPGYSTKSMLSMNYCIQMHNHYCWGKTSEYENKNQFHVSPEFASNQHYKKCHLNNECKKMLEESKEFDSILAYKEKLVENVLKVKGFKD